MSNTNRDRIISDLTAILKKNTRGGDEFAIIFSETSLADAHEVMERIRHKFEARFHSSYGHTISAGTIELAPDQDIKDLPIKADQALYKAKTQKNSVITVTN